MIADESRESMDPTAARGLRHDRTRSETRRVPKRPAAASAQLLTAPYTLTPSCTLTEDYLMVNPQVASSGLDRVAAFQLGTPTGPASATHSVVMIPDHTQDTQYLLHVYPDPGSPGGWATTTIPNTNGVTDFVVANLFHPANQPTNVSNTVELYCRTSTNTSTDLSIYRLNGMDWQKQTGTLDGTGPLQVDHALIGFSGSGATVYLSDNNNNTISWRSVLTDLDSTTVYTGTFNGVPVLESVKLTALFNGSMAVVGCGDNGQVATFSVPSSTVSNSRSQPQSLGQPKLVSLPSGQQAKQVWAMGSVSLASFAVVEDTLGNLWTVASKVTKIWDAETYGRVDDVTELQIFPKNQYPLLDLLVRVGDTLYLIHQIHQNDNSTTLSPLDGTQPQFSPPVPLQSRVAAATTVLSPTQSDARAIVTVDSEGAIAVLSQPAGGQAWQTQRVLLGGNQPLQVDTYRVQLSFTDTNGLPAAGIDVSITAASPVLALAYNATQTLGPAATHFTTDSYGRVVFAVLAEGLSTPDLTVTAANLADGPVTVSPAARVHDFLTGKGTLHASDYTLTSYHLQNATVNGQPLAPNLDTASATTAVNLMATAIDTGRGQTPATTGVLRLGTPHRQSPGPTQVGNLQLSLGDFAEDIWHAVKTATVTVETVARDDATKAFTVVVSDADKLEAWGEATITATVKDITDAINVVHSVFNQIGAAVEDAIAWLREGVLELLHDTATVAEVLYRWLSAAPDFLASTADSYKNQIDNALNQAKAQIDNALSSSALPSGTLTALATGTLSTTRGQRGAGLSGNSVPDPTLFSGNDHANWLLHKILDEFSGTLNPVDDKTASTLQHSIDNIATELSSQVKTYLEDFWHQLSGIQFNSKIDNPQEVKNYTIAKLAEALKDVLDDIIQLTKAIIDALIDLAIMLLEKQPDGTEGLLQQYIFAAPLPLDKLPLIGTLLKDTSISNLTFGKIVCLIVAFPVCFIYQLSQPDGTPSLATLLQSPSMRSRLAAGDDEPDIDTARRWLSSGGQGVWAFFDVILDLTEADDPFLTAIDVATPVLISVLTCPGSGIPFRDIPHNTTAERWQLGAYFPGYLPPLVSGGSYLATQKKLLRDTKIGPAIVSLLGYYLMGVGITANVLAKADGGAWSATILGNLTWVGGILGSDDFKEATEGTSLVMKVVIDFFCGIGAAVGMGFA